MTRFVTISTRYTLDYTRCVTSGLQNNGSLCVYRKYNNHGALHSTYSVILAEYNLFWNNYTVVVLADLCSAFGWVSSKKEKKQVQHAWHKVKGHCVVGGAIFFFMSFGRRSHRNPLEPCPWLHSNSGLAKYTLSQTISFQNVSSFTRRMILLWEEFVL